MSKTFPIQIVQGGQFGSEAKGAICGWLALEERDHVGLHYAVRTGATNAGHTVEYKGHRCAMQQLPVGWVNPVTVLVLGAGALIDLEILEREMKMVTEMTGRDVRDRLYIDHRAYIHRHEHKERSSVSDRHHLIGATGKGCSEALIDRIRLRGREDWTFGSHNDLGVTICDTERLLNHEYDRGARIQLEGTQGQGLDLYLGPYPYTTHKQTGPAQWMLECGLSPALPTEIVMVIRTFPIRVAGNSGPLSGEISWPTLAREINRKRLESGQREIVDPAAIARFEVAVRAQAEEFKSEGLLPAESDGLDMHRWSSIHRHQFRDALSELHARALKSLPESTVLELRQLFEITTVTKKLRRIAALDFAQLKVFARQVRPSWVALNFLNYVFPERWYTDDRVTEDERDYIAKIAAVCNAPIKLINRGPAMSDIIEVAP